MLRAQNGYAKTVWYKTMVWFSSMTDYAQRRTVMVDTQVRPSDVTKLPIIDAMLSVPREAFVPEARRDLAYMGADVPLSADRVMLEPRTLAKMLDVLDVTPLEMVLIIGAGFGYTAAIVSRMAEAVIAVEEDPDMATEAETTLGEHGADNVAVINAPLAQGSARHGPYDVILIEGGIAKLPQAIADQLKDGGRIAAVFMAGALGEMRVGYKIDGVISWRMAFNATAPMLDGFEKKSGFVF
jgi:protein-L-isoaspartate(D-aspartate) O-methyltransferase